MPLVQKIPQSIPGLNPFRREPLLVDGSCYLFDFSYQPECWVGGNPTTGSEANNIANLEVDPIIPLGTLAYNGYPINETAGKGLTSVTDEAGIFDDEGRFNSQVYNGGNPHDWCISIWFRWGDAVPWLNNTYWLTWGGRLEYMSIGPNGGLRFNGTIPSGFTGNPGNTNEGELVQAVISSSQYWTQTPVHGKSLLADYSNGKPVMSALPASGIQVRRWLNFPDENETTLYRIYLEDLTVSGRTTEQVMDLDWSVVTGAHPGIPARPYVDTP